jgi:hypothetical protein
MSSWAALERFLRTDPADVYQVRPGSGATHTQQTTLALAVLW